MYMHCKAHQEKVWGKKEGKGARGSKGQMGTFYAASLGKQQLREKCCAMCTWILQSKGFFSSFNMFAGSIQFDFLTLI